jgi:Winged helix DNA-binding domain
MGGIRKQQRVSGNKICYVTGVPDWSFLTNHARVLLCIAHDPGARLRDISSSLDITERTAHGIITDLTKAGYVVKQKDGRRNRYRIETDLPLREPLGREPAIGEVLAVLLGTKDGLAGLTGPGAAGQLRGDSADGPDFMSSRAGAPGGPGGAGRAKAAPPEGRPLPPHPGRAGTVAAK